jgi:hypothetical protein
MLLASFFAYAAGACAQGMDNHKYGWKKDLIIIFFLFASWYFSIALIGYVVHNT